MRKYTLRYRYSTWYVLRVDDSGHEYELVSTRNFDEAIRYVEGYEGRPVDVKITVTV